MEDKKITRTKVWKIDGQLVVADNAVEAINIWKKFMYEKYNDINEPGEIILLKTSNGDDALNY